MDFVYLIMINFLLLFYLLVAFFDDFKECMGFFELVFMDADAGQAGSCIFWELGCKILVVLVDVIFICDVIFRRFWNLWFILWMVVICGDDQKNTFDLSLFCYPIPFYAFFISFFIFIFPVISLFSHPLP